MGNVSFNVPQMGEWTVSGLKGGQTITQTVNVAEKEKIYSIELLFNSAQITVISPVGTALLLQNGSNQLTQISTGTNVFIVTVMGEWTISGSLEGYTLNSTSVITQNGGEYSAQLSIQVAALTVIAPTGTIVKVSGNGEENEQTITDTSVVFNLTQLGSYTVSGTKGDFTTNIDTIDITQFQPYSVTLSISTATITISTIEGTLVTARNGSTTLSGTATNGSIIFETQILGDWNVDGELSGYTFPSQAVSVQSYQNYPVNLEPSYATLTVTAPNETYITVQNESNTYYGKVNGDSTDILVYALGEYTVSGENNGLVTDTQNVNIAEFSSYSTSLTIWSATITVTTSSGTTVNASNGDINLSEVSYDGTALFTVQKTGTWTLSASFDTQIATTTVNVSEQTNYTAILRVPTIVVTTVFGSVVTCIQSSTTITKTAQGDKVYFYPPTLGQWTLNATLNQQSSNTVIVDVQENQDYPLMLDYNFATITVTTVEGAEVTAQNGAITIVQTATTGTAVFEVATMGTWTLSTFIDEVLFSEQVEVSDSINYDVELLPRGVTYIGTITPLSMSASNLAGASHNTYALFGGGYSTGSSAFNLNVNIYNDSLESVTPSQLSTARESFAAASSSTYCMFGGGNNGSALSVVDAYDEHLTHTVPTPLSVARDSLAAGSLPNYVFFGGGYTNKQTNVVDVYDSQLTRTTPTALSIPRYYLTASGNGTYVLFAGGKSTSGIYYSTVDAYDSQLSHLTPTELSGGNSNLAGSDIGEFMLFGGGTIYNVVDAYDEQLTRTSLTPLSQIRENLSSASNGMYVLFGGGKRSVLDLGTVDAYDSGLTRTNPDKLSQNRDVLAAANIGTYILFAGGDATNVSSSVVDVYNT